VSPSGFLDDSFFGNLDVSRGPVVVSPTGIPTQEVFGGATSVTPGDRQIYLGNILSEETFGATSVTPGVRNIDFTGIPSSEEFGATVVTRSNQIEITGIQSAEAFGNHVVDPPIAPAGDQEVTFAGITTEETFGFTVVEPLWSIVIASIPTAEATGNPTVTAYNNVTISSILPTFAFGDLDVTRGPVEVDIPPGILSAEAFGNLDVGPPVAQVHPTGVPSEETFGSVIVDPPLPPDLEVTPIGNILTAEAFGSLVLWQPGTGGGTSLDNPSLPWHPTEPPR
jgi:hypothetical protein